MPSEILSNPAISAKPKVKNPLHAQKNIRSNKALNLLNKDVEYFNYSKKDHINLFRRNNMFKKLYNRSVADNNVSILDYQNLLVYSFITSNLKKGDRILHIGKENSEIFDKIKNDYECWEMERPEDLKIDTSKNNEDFSITKSGNKNIRLKNCYNYFNLVFSNSEFDNLKYEEEIFNNIVFNLNRLINFNGFSVHNFGLRVKNNIINKNNFLIFLIRKSHSINSNVRGVTKYTNPSSLKDSDDVHYFAKPKSILNLNVLNRTDKLISYNLILKKEHPQLAATTVSKPAGFLKKKPAYIFHHLMKCGGVSLGLALQQWFILKNDLLGDYEDYHDYITYKYNIENLTSDVCIRGHFYHEGIHWYQRYPEILTRKDEFKVFTFIRDPLEVKISLYYFAKNRGLNHFDKTLSKTLNDSRNFLASMLGCNESNYKEILDMYYFIGIVEDMQGSFDKLANLLNKKKIHVPVANKSVKDSQRSGIQPYEIERFKDNNKLDYMIYDYCMERYLKM